jgi:transposase
MESTADTYVGLDVHRKIVVATALDSAGHELAQEKFGPEPSELIDFLSHLPGRKHVALEACSMWVPYYDTAASTGAVVTLSNPYKTRLIAEASLKSDKVDSEALARLLRVDSLPTSFAPPPHLRALRSLVQDRLFYRRYWTAVANHTYHFLIGRGIPYQDRLLRAKRRRVALRKLGLPEVDRGLDTLQEIEDRCKELDDSIDAAWQESVEAQLLTTIPGVGKLTAVTLVAFLCPIERFRTYRHAASYVGLVPRSYQSADRQYHGKLKRDSNALLRWILVEASWTNRQRESRGDVARKARRISRRRGSGKGTVAGAHKLLRIVYTILKERRPYHPHAPEPTALIQSLWRPRTATIQRVGRATLGPSATDCLPALQRRE